MNMKPLPGIIYLVYGANSAVRSEIVTLASNSQNDVIPLGTSYKELTLGLLEDGSELLENGYVTHMAKRITFHDGVGKSRRFDDHDVVSA